MILNNKIVKILSFNVTINVKTIKKDEINIFYICKLKLKEKNYSFIIKNFSLNT